MAATDRDYPLEEVQNIAAHDGAAFTVKFNQTGDYCLSGGRDRTIRLWNPHKGTKIQEYKGQHGYEILGLAVSKDNSQFASCGGDRVAFLWDVSTSQVCRRFRGHTNKINTIVLNSESTIVVTGSFDCSMKAWDCRSNMKDAIQTMADFQDSVTSVVIRSNYIMGACVDGNIRTYDLRMGKLITDYIGYPITSLSLSNDDNCVLVSCMHNSVKLFDAAVGSLLAEYTGHIHKEYSMTSCFTNNDGFVVSGSEDGNIFIWSLVEGKLMHTLVCPIGRLLFLVLFLSLRLPFVFDARGFQTFFFLPFVCQEPKNNSKMVTGLHFHPTTACLVAVYFDGTLRLWK